MAGKESAIAPPRPCGRKFRSTRKQKPSAVGADQAPDRQPNELTLVLHGARLELTADLDLAGLDNLRHTLTCYERILQLLTPDRQVGSEIR